VELCDVEERDVDETSELLDMCVAWERQVTRISRQNISKYGHESSNFWNLKNLNIYLFPTGARKDNKTKSNVPETNNFVSNDKACMASMNFVIFLPVVL
jgi:hypothetical protein